MSTSKEEKQFSPLFPDVPRESPVIDKDGNFTELWFLGIGDLFQALQVNFTSEGIQLPQLGDTDIAKIQSIYAAYIGAPLPINVPDISGKTIFDTTNRVPKVFIIKYDGASPPNVASAQWYTYTVT